MASLTGSGQSETARGIVEVGNAHIQVSVHSTAVEKQMNLSYSIHRIPGHQAAYQSSRRVSTPARQVSRVLRA